MDIIAGQSFIPMGSGGQLTLVRATNVPPCRLITLAIILPTASNSVAAVTLWSNLDPLPDQSTFWPIPCWKSGEKLPERMSNSPLTGFLPALCKTQLLAWFTHRETSALSRGRSRVRASSVVQIEHTYFFLTEALVLKRGLLLCSILQCNTTNWSTLVPVIQLNPKSGHVLGGHKPIFDK